MSLLRNITSGLRSLFRKEQVNRELDEELGEYLEMAAVEKMKQGMSRQDAFRAVRLEGGSLDGTKEIVRSGGWEVRSGHVVAGSALRRPHAAQKPRLHARRDAHPRSWHRWKHRGLQRHEHRSLRFLPLPNPQQLVFLRLPNAPPDGVSSTGDVDRSFSYRGWFEALRKEHAVFSDLMAYVPLAVDQSGRAHRRDPEEAEGDMVSGNFFSGLGVFLYARPRVRARRRDRARQRRRSQLFPLDTRSAAVPPPSAKPFT